nr:type II secretion system protein GspG [uncultured Desulfobulbus sp.]
MNAATVGMLTVIASVSAVYMDVPEQLKGIYQESVAEAQRVSTAGDLKSISVMLDAAWIMDRRLPSEENFADWMAATFKENNVKELAEDHWGSPYVYTVDGRRYELRSVGPDGEAGTDDDMTISGP